MEKKAALAPADAQNLLDLPNLCFLVSNVESGTATAVVIHTGNQSYFGSLATSIVEQRQLTGFDLGINKFTWLMIRFITVMVPAVFLIDGLSNLIFGTGEDCHSCNQYQIVNFALLKCYISLVFITGCVRSSVG